MEKEGESRGAPLSLLQERIYYLFGDVYDHALGLYRDDLLRVINDLMILVVGDADPAGLAVDLSRILDELTKVMVSPVSELRRSTASV
jgi:hypothetical protein